MSSVFETERGRVLFLHIPKTGGTWVERVLSRLGLCGGESAVPVLGAGRHGLRCHYERDLAFTFSFVRHPLDWYESWYRYQRGRWQVFESGNWHPQRALEGCGDDNFNVFIDKVGAVQPAYVTRMYEWFLGPPGWPLVDFVGRQENLAADLHRALALAGIDVSPEQIDAVAPANVSPSIAIEWDMALRKRVLAAEHPTIERFYG